MIRLLLNKSGKATVREIAEEIVKFDPSQIEYYEKIVNNMVGKVLRGVKNFTDRKFNKMSLHIVFWWFFI